MKVDLNADVGEGFREGDELLSCITSANIACGFHAGDAKLIYQTVQNALNHGVGVGAHPSLSDRENFGRLPMAIGRDELLADLLYQIGAVNAIVGHLGGSLAHIKPHGALYHMAENDEVVAETICTAVRHFGPEVALFARSMGNLAAVAEPAGIRVAHEVFADRSILPDGNLTPRSEPDSVIQDAGAVSDRMLRLIREGILIATDGTPLALKADTICFHGDTPGSSAFAKRLRDSLLDAGIEIAQFR
jgi:UPF0271 protein